MKKEYEGKMKVKDIIDFGIKTKIQAGMANTVGKYVFFTSSEDESKRYNEYCFDDESIIMGTGGNATLHYYKGKCAVSTDCLVLKTKKNVESKYLYYFFKQNMKILQDGFKGAGLKHTNKNYIGNININLLPDVKKQKEIVNKIDIVSNTMKLYQTQLKNFDLLVKSRFVEMFGARLEKEQILLNEIADFTIGLTYKPENISENGTIVLRSGNIQNNSLQIVEDVVRVEGVKIPENKYIKKNDILMCSRNGSARLVGKSCLITETKEKMSFGAFMTIIRSKYPYFLQSFFNSDYFKEQLTSVATTSVNQITTYMLNGYKTIKPTDDEEKEFSNFVIQVDKSKFAVQEALNKTKMLMDSLMQEYFG